MVLHRVPSEPVRSADAPVDPEPAAVLPGVFRECALRLRAEPDVDEVREQAGSRLAEVSEERLVAAFKELVADGLLEAFQDHGRDYRTVADYERRSVRYALTDDGAAALIGASGGLRIWALAAIGARLAELAGLLADPGAPDGRVCSTLLEVEGHLADFRDGAAVFHVRLSRTLRAEAPAEPDTLAYLQESLTKLDAHRHAVRAALAEADRHGVAALHERALRGAELPPDADPDDWLAHRRERWVQLRAWLGGAVPRLDELRDVARRAIVRLLRGMEPGAGSGAATDFRQLARWFATAGDEDEMHRLWAAAFGLGPARHAHLAHEDPELVAVSTPWEQAPQVRVSALLRSSGRTESFTRTGKVRDVRQLAELRRARARQERAELEAAWQRLASDGAVRLSAFGELESGEFDRLLDLLGRALATSADSTGARRAMTGDGGAELVLRDAGDDREAVLRTTRGSLRGKDFVVDVRRAAG